MSNIVIIHGAHCSGKTRRINEFLKHYKCTNIIDGYDGVQKLKDGDLAITNLEPPFNVNGATVISVDKAKMEVTQ